MKKVLFVFAIAATFAACNNSTETTATVNTDSIRMADSTRTADSLKMEAAKMDTTTAHKMDTTAHKMDSTAKKMDKKMDSAKK